MNKETFDRLVDDWINGFVPENEHEAKIVIDFKVCLMEISRQTGWKID